MWNARGTVNDTEGVDRRAVLGMGTLRESQARRGHPQPPTQVPPSTPQPRPRCPRYCRDHGRRARTTKKLLNGQRRSGNQVPTEDGWRGSQRIISSSLPSWTNWTEGQGDDQGPTVQRSGLLGVFRTVLVFLLQAAFFRSRKSLSTSLGVRYPRAE